MFAGRIPHSKHHSQHKQRLSLLSDELDKTLKKSQKEKESECDVDTDLTSAVSILLTPSSGGRPLRRGNKECLQIDSPPISKKISDYSRIVKKIKKNPEASQITLNKLTQ
jgi:hypothetical protein